MKKRLMASVLLAGMAVVFPVYADGDRTPDEYNSNAKYESPLDQPEPVIVNDYRAPKTVDESDIFAEAANTMLQGDASGRDRSPGRRIRKDTEGVSALEGSDLPDPGKERNDSSTEVSESVTAEQKKPEVAEAEKRAEKVLEETDENFEPALATPLPGHEYQARRQISSLAAFQGSPKRNVLTTDTGSENSMFSKNGEKDSSGQKVNSRNKTLENTFPENQFVSETKNVPPVSKTKKEKTKSLPLIITGEDAQYDTESGDFIIEGNVNVRQGLTKLSSTKAVGNEKSGDIWLLEGGTLQEPTNTVHAHWAHYNFNKETGELLHLKGASNKGGNGAKKDYYEAPHGVIENGMLVIDQGGMTTSCPAVRHSSCLSVKAKTITIIPNERIIARGVQVFVKGKHIYSRDVWVNDLQQSNNRLMPHVGWNGDKGFYIALDYEQPIGNPLLKNPTKAYMHQVYYTKSKYKPFYGIRHDEKDFYIRLNHGYVYDSDNDDIDEGIWLHKKMDWGLFWKPHRISKKLPLTYEAYITHGLWQYSHRDWSSWHTEKVIRLKHDRFYPLGGKKLYMDLMVGRKWVDESYGNFAIRQKGVTTRYGKSLNSNIYEGTLGYRFSKKWNIWTRYHNEHKTSRLFSLGQPDFAKEWRTGISWKPDEHNTFTVVNRHNSDSSTSSHGNYSTVFRWSHRFCCEVLTVQYERKHYKGDHEWTVEMEFLNW